MMLNKDTAVPLYNQLIDKLIDEIKNNLSEGDKLLSEREICQKYDVSRTTVRLALTELEDLGYVFKRHGKGTFVSGLWKEMSDLSDSYSFTEHMKSLGKNPKTMIIEFTQTFANKVVAKKLGLKDGAEVYRLVRLRVADNIPMMYETSYVPVSLFPNLTAKLINSKPLYNIFYQDYQCEISYADEEFYASLVQEKEAQYLGVEVNDACLRIQRETHRKDNQVIEYTISVARSDQFVYKIRHAKK